MFFSACILFYGVASAQIIQKSDSLFNNQDLLKIKLSYSNDEMRLDTDDTTYIKVNLEYNNDNKWESLNVNLRARGNFRRSKCYFPPIKIRIKKSAAKGTLFEGNKNLKLERSAL